MSEPTAAPWIVNPQETWVDGFGDGFEVQAATLQPERTLPGLLYTVALCQRIEDAHLIAAAPDLYEALEEAVETMRIMLGDLRLLTKGYRALAKARGESSTPTEPTQPTEATTE